MIAGQITNRAVATTFGLPFVSWTEVAPTA